MIGLREARGVNVLCGLTSKTPHGIHKVYTTISKNTPGQEQNGSPNSKLKVSAQRT